MRTKCFPKMLYGMPLVVVALMAAAYLLVTADDVSHAQTSTPAKPTGLTASPVAHDSVTLNWDEPEDSSIMGYQVLRRSRDGDEYGDGQGAAEFVAVVGDTGSSATTYTDTSVTPRTRYVYRVKAINSAGEPGRGIAMRHPIRVYPREYGGTHIRPLTCKGRGGLSPRVRGNLTPELNDQRA